MKLYYFPVRGGSLGPIHYLIADRELPVENMLARDWPKQKAEWDLPFGQLPYLEDGEVKLAQSQAIQRYLADKVGAMGEGDAKKRSEIDMWCEYALDVVSSYRRAMLSKDEKQQNEFLDAFGKKLEPYERKMSPNGMLFWGDFPSMADYCLLYLTDVYMVHFDKIDGLPKVASFRQRMLARTHLVNFTETEAGKLPLLPQYLLQCLPKK